MKSERFNRFMPVLLKHEGGYSNTKDDNGGETFAGITRKYHPTLKVWQSLDGLKDIKEKKAYKPTDEELDEIYEVYYKKYYVPVSAEYIDNEKLAFSLYSFGVNAGTTTSVKLLQKVLGITQDGKCGPQTVGTANAQSNVFPRFVEAMKDYYKSIVARNPTQKKFLNGWLKRASFVFE